MPEIHVQRRERLRAAVAASDADAALITTLVNVRYLTGLASSNAALLVPADAEPVLATDSRYAGAAERDCPGIEQLIIRTVEAGLAELAVSRGMSRLAFEAQEMTVERHTALAATDGLALLVPLGHPVEELRAVKDDGELALLARACEITGWAFDQVAPRIRAGMTERELAVLVERAMVDAGAEPGFTTIVASGPNGAIPHHAPGERRFEPGDMITIDCGARYGGYHADMTRTVALGEPAEWQREIYGLVATAQRAGIGAATVGAAAADVDAAARDLITEAGYGEHFGHGLGHGVGLEIHELPFLGQAKPGTLGDRVPVTVEPGIYLPGRGGVRIEDTLVVRSGAASAAVRDLLTTTKTVTPGELLVLGP
jgi:Xaa-Pro aminopeptidase